MPAEEAAAAVSEAEAEAELEAEAEEKRRLDYVSWLPKPGSVRAWILDALKNGHYHRDAIYKHVRLQPGLALTLYLIPA